MSVPSQFPGWVQQEANKMLDGPVYGESSNHKAIGQGLQRGLCALAFGLCDLADAIRYFSDKKADAVGELYQDLKG